jgi:hypothetical protein
VSTRSKVIAAATDRSARVWRSVLESTEKREQVGLDVAPFAGTGAGAGAGALSGGGLPHPIAATQTSPAHHRFMSYWPAR